MKKAISLFVLLMILVCALSGCYTGLDSPSYVPPEGIFSDPTEKNEIKSDVSEIKEAVAGYYNGEEKKSVVEGTEYLNLFNTRTFYVTPGVDYILPFEGKAEDWEVTSDPYELIKENTLRIENEKLIIKTAEAGVVVSGVSGKITNVRIGTGYIYFKNKSNGEIAKVYVNMPVIRDETNKQTNKDLPYYLYYEKGNYKSFFNGDCCLTVYTVDEDGYYTVPYLTFSSACGVSSELTPTGIHKIGGSEVGSLKQGEKRERWHDWGGNQYGQFATTYADGRFLHGPTTAPCNKEEDKVLKDSYNQIGSHASGGCLRMQTGAAYWIFTHCPDGTTLEIRANNPRGTRIERPENLKKSKGYDPTDPYLINYDL